MPQKSRHYLPWPEGGVRAPHLSLYPGLSFICEGLSLHYTYSLCGPPQPWLYKYACEWWWRQVDWRCPVAEPQLFDWHQQPVPLVQIPGGCSLNFKLLPYSLLQQTDRYLLMSPHAPVTLAPFEALREQPLLLSGLFLVREGVAVERAWGKGQGRGHRVLRC